MTKSEQGGAKLFRLIFPGNILPGTDHDEVVFELARLLKTSPDRAIRLVSGKRRYVKRTFTYERADRLRVQVLELGVECELEPVKERNTAKEDGSRRKKHFPKPESVALQAESGQGDVSQSDQLYSDKMAAFEKHASVEREQSAEKRNPVSFDEAIMSFNDEQDEEEKSTSLSSDKQGLAQFVVDNVDHYLKVFDKFMGDGDPRFAFSWHWPAFFVPFFWAVYRKLWVWSFIMLISLIFLPIVSNIVWGGIANYIFFKHSLKKVKKIRKHTSSGELDMALREEGGTSTFALTGAILILLLFMNGLYWTDSFSPVFSTLSENLEQLER